MFKLLILSLIICGFDIGKSVADKVENTEHGLYIGKPLIPPKPLLMKPIFVSPIPPVVDNQFLNPKSIPAQKPRDDLRSKSIGTISPRPFGLFGLSPVGRLFQKARLNPKPVGPFDLKTILPLRPLTATKNYLIPSIEKTKFISGVLPLDPVMKKQHTRPLTPELKLSRESFIPITKSVPVYYP